MPHSAQELMDRIQSHVKRNTNLSQPQKPTPLQLRCRTAVLGSHRLSHGDLLAVPEDTGHKITP